MIVNPNKNIEDHKHWCTTSNFGVNNFDMQLKHFPLSKIRYDFGLHTSCAIARKILHWFRSHIDRCDNKEDFCMCFEMLWKNTHY